MRGRRRYGRRGSASRSNACCGNTRCIAFADLRHIIEWDADGLRVKALDDMSDADVAAISEIVPGARAKASVRVKLYDKKAALDAIARHLGMFPLPTAAAARRWRRRPAEDPREVLARWLARLAAGDRRRISSSGR